MTSVLWSLLAGGVFGLALAAPPGPMNAVIAEESVRNGWWAGVRTGAGAMTADVAFFVLALVGVVRDAPLLGAVMIAAGGVLMLYFAYGAARAARSGHGTATLDRDGAPGRSGRTVALQGSETATVRAESQTGGGFRKALALSITNPYQIVFWLTVGVRLLEPGTVDVLGMAPWIGGALAGQLLVETGSAALLVGFFGGILVWILAFPTVLVGAQHRLRTFGTAVAVASAVILAGYGTVFLFDAATTLLGSVS